MSISLGALGNGLPVVQAAPAKLAIVDVGTKEKVPAGFLEFLLADLSKHPDVALLERTEIDKLLREQNLGLAISAQVNSADAVKAGRLWAVDAFVLLEAEKPTGKQIPLRVRLVETRYGIKLWDFLILLDEDPGKFQQQAGLLAQVVPQHLNKLRCSKDDPILISVVAFHSEEVSSRWNWLAEALAGGVEQNLGLQPQIVVLERARTRPLTDERSVISDLPPALQPAAVTIDGAYRLNREKGGEALEVDLRARRNGAVFWETRLEGSVNEIGVLCQQAAGVVMKAVGMSAECAPLEAGQEAQMLAAEAGRCTEINDVQRALHLAEAALALQPENYDYATQILGYLEQTKKWAYLKNEKFDPETTVPYLRYGLSLMDRALRCRPAGQPYKYPEGWQFNAILEDFASSVIQMEQTNPDIVDDLRDLFWDLLKRWKAEPMDVLIRGKFVQIAKRATGLIHSPEEAIRYAEQAWRETADAFAAHPEAGGDGYEHFMAPCWHPTPVAERLYVQLLERHAADPNPLMRMAAEYSLIVFHTDTSCSTAVPSQAVPHLEKFADVIEAKFLTVYAHVVSCRLIIDLIIAEPMRRRYAAEFFEDTAIKLRYGNRLTEFVLASGNKDYVFACLSVISETAKLLEKSGRVDAAVDVLQRTLTIFGTGNRNQFVLQLVGQLHALKPTEPLGNIGSLAVACPHATITVCYPADGRAGKNSGPGLPTGNIQFQRIIPTDNGWVLLYVRGQEVGILGLTADFQPTRHQLLPLTRPPYSGGDAWFHRYPELVVEGTDVYAGIYGRGIVWFPEDREPVHFCETNGLPGEAIESMAVLNRKVYAVIAGSLVQLDPATARSKVLFPSRVAQPTNEIEGHSKMRILANAASTSLWLHVSGNIYLYHPQSHSWERRTNPKDPCPACDYGCLKYSGGRILASSGQLCVQYDKDLNLQTATATRGHTNLNDPQCVSAVSSGLVAVCGRELLFLRNGPREPPYHYRSQLAGLDIGKYREPEHLVDARALQAKLKNAHIRDLFPVTGGLMVLSDDKLLLISGLNAEAKSP